MSNTSQDYSGSYMVKRQIWRYIHRLGYLAYTLNDLNGLFLFLNKFKRGFEFAFLLPKC